MIPLSLPSIESDVHLRIWLSGIPLDYRAASEVAYHFISEWRRNRCETIELVLRSVGDLRLLPRLPCERLFR